jgi:hypothetical protein
MRHATTLLSALLLCAASTHAQDPVDLFLVPGGCVDVGDDVRVDIFAASSTTNISAVSAIDVIITWDAALLELVSIDTSFAQHPWLLTAFLPDPDGINASTSDGDALLTLLTSPGLPALVPQHGGIIATSLTFRPIAPVPAGTAVSIAPILGAFGQTAVYSYDTPGLAITGNVSDSATIVTCPFGAVYCTAAVPNSTGLPGEIRALGSTVVAENDFRLRATQLPLNSFGFFLASRFQDFRPFPGGSQGILCLGDPIGRGVGNVIFFTGATGSATVNVDLNLIPQPSVFVSVMPGEMWNFQCWHRDVNPAQTSNFSDAIAVEFQ